MDVSLRSLIILNSADLIAAEDTRVTRKLLNYFQIKNSIISYNENSNLKVRHKIIKLISENKLIALVSDAGTPLISDPGFKLVKECIKRELEVFSVPGPTAFVSALVASGIEPSPVTFIGFLPIKKSSRNKKLFELWNGLGYWKRALNLRKTAEIIQVKYEGVFPNDIDTLKTLPGVGEYTSAALKCFIYNYPVAFVETNIRKVIKHFFENRGARWPTWPPTSGENR